MTSRAPAPWPVRHAGRVRLPADRHALGAADRARDQNGHRSRRDLAGTGRFFAGRLDALQAAGITRDRLIIDPGLGYFPGSTPEPSLAALTGIGELKARFGVPVLVSPSRKSSLRALTGCSLANAGPASLAAELFAASHGAGYIRTHDISALRDALTVLTALARQARPDPAPPDAAAT